MATTEGSKRSIHRWHTGRRSRRSSVRRSLQGIGIWIDAEGFLFRSVVQEVRQACEANPGQLLAPGSVVTRRRGWIITKGAVVALGGVVVGFVIVVAVVFMWGLVALVAGMIAGQVLRWGWGLIGGDASQLQGPFSVAVAATVLLVALGVSLYRRVKDGVDPARRWIYGLVWDWVEARFVEPAEPTAPTRPAWVPPGPIEVLEPVTRSVTFPTDRSYGVVYHRPGGDCWGGREDWWPGAWQRLIDKLAGSEPAFSSRARGTVSVPAGGQLRLWSSQKDDEGVFLPAELGMLRTFAPDAFDSLAVLWPADGEQLAHVAHLSELQELVVLSRFGDTGLTDLGALESLRSLDLAYNQTLTDDGVATLLARNPKLAYVYLSGTAITDASLRRIGERVLSVVELNRTAVTNEGVAVLRGQPGMTQLGLRDTAITDAALAGVADTWRSLEALDIEGTAITDRVWLALGDMPRLRNLLLSETSVSAEQLDPAAFGRLELLTVSKTELSDVGLRRIATLPRLRALMLYDTKITNVGLEALHGHPTLEQLYLHSETITDWGVADLLESLPALRRVDGVFYQASSTAGIKELKDKLRAGVGKEGS